MDSAQEQKLIEFLEGLGFKGEAFTSVLQDQIQKGDARFTVTYMQAFDEDKVRFDLHFQRDFQFDAYRLEKYNAILRQLPEVRREIIGDTDTAALEERMKQINWKDYFSQTTDAFTANEKARQIYRDVERLAKYSDKGAVIAGLLQVRYCLRKYGVVKQNDKAPITNNIARLFQRNMEPATQILLTIYSQGT